MQINNSSLRARLGLLAVFVSFVAPSFAAETDSTRLLFDIFLNKKNIGQQSIVISQAEFGEHVVIESEFNIKLLFVNVFAYQHSAKEQWRDSCLENIETTTQENSDRFFVESTKNEEGLRITNRLGTTHHIGCVRSFAYWDIARLDSPWLLNGQTGDYVPAKLVAIGSEEFVLRGKKIPASRYTLTAEGSDISLWYDENQNWVGLSTQVKGGRTLSYRLQ